MNCIVTAGPTFEPLDEVRRMTNFSTGRLGTELANYLTARGHKVTLLIGASATYGGDRKAKTVKVFTTTADLQAQLKALAAKKVDAIFHAAAVSDFAFGQIFVEQASGGFTVLKASKKISTRQGSLLVELVPTPKIISKLRRWFPRTVIVGWKFEANGRRTNAIGAAQRQLVDCDTDACVANGPAYGRGFSIVTGGGQKHYATAEKLFAALASL